MFNAEEKLMIQELLARCAYAYDERDLDMLASCFSADAEMAMCIAGGDVVGPFKGRDQLREMFENAMSGQQDVRRHVISNIFFSELEGASVVYSNLTLLATENGNTKLITAGIYTDHVEFSQSEWVIKKRHLDLDSGY
ncbi:MAG: nuclear transport factor 2 family protein [Halieaceae bacterium]|nr:nuclear transport factor 2 family protein [Halieaceae bacterium]